MKILKHQMETNRFLLQILLLNVNVFSGISENREAVIRVRLEGSRNARTISVTTDKYESFIEKFFNNRTSSLTIGYSSPPPRHIYDIHSKENTISNKCFTCRNNQDINAIECKRNSGYTVNCTNGFGICWLYKGNGDYIDSAHLNNYTDKNANRYKATCYIKVNNNVSTTAETTTTSSSTFKVNTELTVSSLFTSRNYSFQVFNYSLTSTPIYTGPPTNIFTTLKLLPVDQTPNSSSSVFTSVIVGVTVSIGIIIVILIVMLCKRRKLKDKSTNDKETPSIKLEMNSKEFSGHVCSQPDLNYDEHNNNTFSNSTVCVLTNDENSTPKNHCVTYMSDKRNTVNDKSHSIPDSEYSSIEEGQRSTLPDRLLLTDEDKEDDYNNIVHNPGTMVSGPVTQDVEEGNSSIDRKDFVKSKVHRVLPKVEDSTVNMNVGYTYFNEFPHDVNLASVHEYNNIIDDNTTIGKIEPDKNIYSKLRENIRHFDNTYGDFGEPVQAGEDNSTHAHDNTYFILEAIDNSN